MNGIQTGKAEQEAKLLRREFVSGFAQALGLRSAQAAEKCWAEYTQFMSKAQCRVAESGGRKAGQEFGESYGHLFAGLEKD